MRKFKKQNIDTSKYAIWDSEQIVYWILSLDHDRFKHYEEKLKISLCKEGVIGQDLIEVNENDINRWGITQFKDIKILKKKIEELLNKTYQNESNNNEGMIASTQYL